VSLPWVRLDSNIASHDKTLKALSARGGHRAMCVYMFALGWSGGHATDGHIPTAALPMLHGTKADAELLTAVGLWEEETDGWHIHNYAQRQETKDITDAKRAQASAAGRKSACVRKGHPTGCTCWMPGGTVRAIR
jgi:ribonuclease I